jgi:hypothetical protein
LANDYGRIEHRRPKIPTIEARPAPEKVSDQIERWLASDGDMTLGGLIDMFEEKSFALIFILLLGTTTRACSSRAPRRTTGSTPATFSIKRLSRIAS